MTLKLTVAAAALATIGFSAPALAENCPWDMVWSPSQRDCIYLPETPGSAGGSNTNTNSSTSTSGATAGAVAGAISGSQSGANASATGGNASATGGRASSDSSNRNSVTVNQRTRIRHSAAGAAQATIAGYGPGNCFGDTNPSGSFSAAMQTFGWGVTAGSSKASNICAIYAVGGERAALAYLAAMDPNAHRALVAAGLVTTPSRNAAAPAPVRVTCPATHPVYVAGKGCRK